MLLSLLRYRVVLSKRNFITQRIILKKTWTRATDSKKFSIKARNFKRQRQHFDRKIYTYHPLTYYKRSWQPCQVWLNRTSSYRCPHILLHSPWSPRTTRQATREWNPRELETKRFIYLFIYLFHHIRITLEDRIEDKYTSIQDHRLKIIITMKWLHI